MIKTGDNPCYVSGLYNEIIPTDFADRMMASIPLAVSKFIYQGATSHLASTIDKYVYIPRSSSGELMPMEETYMQAWRRLGSR
jgi:hypothetical protein